MQIMVIINLGDNMSKKKLKVKKSLYIKLGLLVIFVVIGVIGIKYFLYRQTNEFKLKEIGYSKEEIITIDDKLNDRQISSLLEKKYDSNVALIVQEKYFIYEYLNKYLIYKGKEKDRSIKDVISVVNAKADQEFYTNIEDADTSKGILILVNKFHKLTKTYKPKDIVSISNQYAYSGHSIEKEVYGKYKEMWNAAKKQDLTLIATSSFRDYDFQKSLYDQYENSNGQEWADSVSARPGHSEHQLGLALDIVTHNSTMDNFDTTDEFKWLKDNAYRYGFILRYPKDKEYITGYAYESWHYRYVGEKVAKEVYDQGITYDEYYAYYLK